eukprot:9375253-Alexandrium_andersonii.AAC.1
MSASLVGSEMCIRDRAWAPQRARNCWTRGRQPRGFAQEVLRRWEAQAETCLLYTSDAADDM